MDKRKRLEIIVGIALVSIMAMLAWWIVKDHDTAARLDQLKAWAEQTGPRIAAKAKAWGEQYKTGTWHCGPTSWAVAHIVNAKFFGGSLPVRFDRGRGDCIRIVLGSIRSPRFEYRQLSHCWVEVYWRGFLIHLDVTYGQFDANSQPVFAFFSEGDTTHLQIFHTLLCLSYAPPPGAEREIAEIKRGDIPEFWRQWAAWLGGVR